MKTIIFAALAVFLTSAHGAIFGVDDREQMTPHSVHYQLSRSTAVAVLSSNVEPFGNGKLKLNVDELTNLCRSERFATDPSLSYGCSGFLVAPDMIVTAGHCMVNTGESRNETDLYCKAYSWLFDFNTKSNGQTQIENIPESKLYRCKRVVYAVKDESAPFRDFALVQLDRPVVGRTPFKINAAPIKNNEKFSMIGYPLGTPAKRSAPAPVLLNNLKRQSFITALDAFEGNSGSVVLNKLNQVIGILIGGTPSIGLIPKAGSRCEVYNRCNMSGTGCTSPDRDTSIFPGFQKVGSEVQRIAPVLEMLKKLRKI